MGSGHPDQALRAGPAPQAAGDLLGALRVSEGGHSTDSWSNLCLTSLFFVSEENFLYSVPCLLPRHHRGDPASVSLSLSQEFFTCTALISAFASVTFIPAMVLPCPSCPGELSWAQGSRVASLVPGRGAEQSPPHQGCCASPGTPDPHRDT